MAGRTTDSEAPRSPERLGRFSARIAGAGPAVTPKSSAATSVAVRLEFPVSARYGSLAMHRNIQ